MHLHCCQADRPRSHADQLVNHVVDCIAASQPQTLFAEYPRAATTYDHGFHKITYGRLAAAVDYIARWLVKHLGPGKDFETLAYIGPNDLRYPALVLGSIKAGYKMLLLSPRNSAVAQLHLMKATKCTKFLHPAQIPASVAELAASHETSGIFYTTVPTLQDLLEAEYLPFAYNKTLAEAEADPFVIMHTSGSTGLPKPIVWPQSFIPAAAKQWLLEPPEGMYSTDLLYRGKRAFIIFPAFHAAYCAHVYINGICSKTFLIFPLSGTVPSAAQISQALTRTTFDVAFVVPSIVEEMSDSPQLLESIASGIDRVVFTGGDLPQGCGDRVAATMELIAFYGTTEFANLPFTHPGNKTRDDWKYLNIHPDALVEFQHHAGDMHELVIVRSLENEHHQPVFTTFPGISEYRTKDLFKPHPTKSHLWTHCGRSDDIMVLLTGEKTNPVPYEQAVFAAHPEIRGVLLVGAQRFQTALVIEVEGFGGGSPGREKELINLFWPTIEEANRNCQDHAKVASTHVWFSDPSRPMIRSPKGTIQRAATLKLYSEAIDRWYRAAETETLQAGHDPTVDIDDAVLIADFLRKEAKLVTGIRFRDEENFFIRGMQSLQALTLSRRIKAVLNDPHFSVNKIYQSPNIKELVTVIRADAKEPSNDLSIEKATLQHQDQTKTYLSRYIEDIDAITGLVSECTSQVPYSGLHVLLTGSTGSLGAHLLNELLSRSDIAHIYCLNRADDGGFAQQLARKDAAQFTKGYRTESVTFLQADLSQEDLGVSESCYELLKMNINCCIHNAWSVNFNTPLSAYTPHLQGVVNLLKFANGAANRPRVVYLSSVAAIGNLAVGQIPETIATDTTAPLSSGYGASKFIAENLIERGCTRLGLESCILRIGQIAGPIGKSQAAWNRQEWLPSLVISSHYVGALPQELPSVLDNVDWVPVDVLSSIIVEISTSEERRKLPTSSGHLKHGNGAPTCCETYNILNPHSVPWSTLAPTIASELSPSPALVPFTHWLDSVKAKFARDSDLDGLGLALAAQRNPAAKLLDFFEASEKQTRQVSWEKRNALAASSELRRLGCVNVDWLQRWTKGWQ